MFAVSGQGFWLLLTAGIVLLVVLFFLPLAIAALRGGDVGHVAVLTLCTVCLPPVWIAALVVALTSPRAESYPAAAPPSWR